MEVRNQLSLPTLPTSPAKPVAEFRGHTDAVIALAFSADRCLLASSSRDGTARVWDVASGKPGERSLIRKSGDNFHSLAFSPGGRALAIGSGELNGLVWLFDVTEKTPHEKAVLRGPRGAVDALAFSPNGKLVAGCGEDRTLRVWSPKSGSSGEPQTLLLGHAQPIRALTFAPDGKGVATAGPDATVRLWTLGGLRSWERANLPQDGEVYALAYSADGKTLATAGRDLIRLWDLTAVKPTVRAELAGHSGAIPLLLITPDSEMLVSVGEDDRAINWNLRTGKPFREWELPGGATPGALTLDGRYLATGSPDGTVRVLRVAEKRS
jgi:WD40 repeat protein